MQQKSINQHIQKQMQQQRQQQMLLNQLQIDAQQTQTPLDQTNFEIQTPMQPNVQVMNKHMFGEIPVSDGAMLVPQQHPHFVGPVQQSSMQQLPMQIETQQMQQLPMQKQKFISPRHEHPGPSMAQNIHGSMSMPSTGKQAEGSNRYVYEFKCDEYNAGNVAEFCVVGK